MKEILDQLIRLNVELEGSLRVLAERESPEAESSARQTLDRLNNLFSQAFPADAHAEAIQEVKDEEAEGGELEPNPEPNEMQIPSENSENSEPSEPTPVPAPAAPLTVDAAIACRESRDLRKAFTLNDKFLFRRELFDGNDQEFSDTIDLLTAMHSLDEAKEYLFDDLHWDPENEVVKDFMAIITNHFRPL